MNSKSIKILVGITAILTIWQICGFNLLIPKVLAADEPINDQDVITAEESSSLETLDNLDNELLIDSSAQLPAVLDQPAITQPETIIQNSSLITQIVFTSSVQTITPNTLSADISIQTQNASGLAEQVSETTYITLTSSSATGIFVFGSADHPTPTTITMNNGTANKNFKYKDSTSGIHTLTASGPIGYSWTAGTSQIRIDGIPPQITNPLASPNIAKGDGLANIALTASVIDDISGVGSVTVDLSQVGYSNLEPMYDDGINGGDLVASDHIYTLQILPLASDAQYFLPITAIDNLGNINSSVSIELMIDNTPPVISDITFDQSDVLLGIGDSITITILAQDNELDLIAHGSFNGRNLIWQDQNDGRYQAVYAVQDGDPSGSDIQITDAQLMDVAGNVSADFGPAGEGIDIDAERPEAPANLKVTAGDGYVDLEWDEVADAISYDIYRTASPVFHNIGSSFINSYRDETVINGHSYLYKVTAIDSAGNETIVDLVAASEEVTPSALGEIIEGALPLGGGEELAAATTAPSAAGIIGEAQAATEGQVEAATEPAEEEEQKEEETSGRNWAMIVAIIIAILVVIGGGYYYWSISSQENAGEDIVVTRRKYKRKISRKK